jgi:hypothetical protein
MAGPGIAHIQLFASTYSSPLRWRLLSGNNREIGRGVAEFADEEACRLAVKHLQNGIDGFESSVRRSASSEWTWELTTSGEPAVRSGHPFARQIRCEQGLLQFLRHVVEADVGHTVLVSGARRWEARSVPVDLPVLRSGRVR